MNSTQLHYCEASHLIRAAEENAAELVRLRIDAEQAVARAQVHATLGLIAALEELTRQAHPDVEAVAEAVGVYRPTPDNVIHHAFNAFGNAE